MIQPAVKGLIEHENRYLLLHKPKSVFGAYQWNDVPGGRMEFGELNPVQALEREIYEETRLRVIVGKPMHMTTLVKTADKQIVATFFHCHYQGGDVRLSEEHDAFSWVDKKDILAGEFPDWLKESINNV